MFLFFTLAIKSYADEKVVKRCQALEDYTEEHHLWDTCINFLSQSGYSDYEPHAIHESVDLNYDLRQIIKNSKSKRFVIFLAEAGYMSEGTIKIEDLDIAFVGVKNSTSNKSHIVMVEPPSPTVNPKAPNKKPGAFIRFDAPAKQLMFKNITLSDVNTHMDHPAPDTTKPIVSTGLIDITSAQSVVIDDSEVESHYHKDAIYFGCGDSALLSDFSLTNSTIKIPAESSHAIDFHCGKKGVHYNAQIAFTTFGFNTAPVGRSPAAKTPTPTNWANKTTSTTTSAFSLPFKDTMIHIDVEGSVKFTNSPCNRLKYTDKQSIQHQVPLDQTLFVDDVMSFDGLLTITEINSPSGTYFTHENHKRIVDDTFYLQELCPVKLDQYNAKKLSNFLPSRVLIQSRLGGQPVTKDETDWESKYYAKNTHAIATTVTTAVLAIATLGLAGATAYYRHKAHKYSHTELVGE
ncbi:hypothetical protein NX722_05090 [Endozoicomonas gorgoniicola]|uniref:Uncharacterized protein n=1 Tax=Endozoicomonas gorgoniicola TaxID=1234144 RepID=A0ABT3MRM4_9GAMM|nr:hypothetical protein [Endozoicomonas gorgoniicola]MCW7552026.1 hypothetical protein [Endozoicomonas gorgoniicola]